MREALLRFMPQYFWVGYVLAIVLAIAGGWLLYRSTSKVVEIHIDEEILLAKTHARTVSSVLRSKGIDPETEDRIYPSLEAIVSTGDRIELIQSRPIIIQVEDQVSQVMTVGRTPTDILHQAGTLLFPGDRIWTDGIPVDDPTAVMNQFPSRIRLQRANELTMRKSGAVHEIRSAAPMLGEALWEGGQKLYVADQVIPAPEGDPKITKVINLNPSEPIQVIKKDGSYHSRVVANSVGEALARAGFSTLGLDFSVPSLEEPLPASGQIKLVRVNEKVIIEQQPLPFTTEYRPVEDMEIDNLRLVEAGQYGIQANRLRVRDQDGEEVDRVMEGEWVAQDPSPEIIGYGSKIVVRSTPTDSGSIEYWRALEMYATSYSPSRAGVSPDHPWFGITASGKPLTKGLVAIDRRYIPFGTRLYVPGYGFAEAADTGGGVKGRWIDLGYDDDNWVSWHQYVTVYFLTPIPDPSNISYVIP